MSKLKNVDPKNITIDPQGRVVIDDAEFAKQLQERLVQRPRPMNPLCIDLDCECP